jgi:ABC-type multidrug transport system fused ATPase/permease subunit
VKIEQEELRDLDVQNARSHMALVQQEPDLFNRSIKENILYGISHKDGVPVTYLQVVEAAKAANAHDFISTLPQGYDTPVGERGSALSGGQRQRIAIARSLIRHPRILLLDEATSALDARSERVVQDALDEARMGRTTIVIAHRLSTVKDADAIALVSRGKVAELMSKGGKYAELVKNQLTEETQTSS